MPGIGTLVNAAAILFGASFGLFFGRFIPERIRTTTMYAIGLTVFCMGMQMALDPHIEQTQIPYAGPMPYRPNLLIVIGGMVSGSILGELLHIERRLESFGQYLHRITAKFQASPAKGGTPDTGSHNLIEGFVTASLVYCIGAMAVIGPIQDAAGQPHVLYVKAMLDGIGSVVLASTLGLGVALSAIPLVLYQGGITLAAQGVAPYLTLPVLATLTATGGLLIAAIGIDLMGIRRLPVGNMLPGVFTAAILAYFLG
ncbi:MAG TPA: DUF554 domain-containing protein [Holophaga sp.]|nr:DUF554 domain-containing protein [Holophaga sp.]HPS66472.1 DUF554 domain-containing protein [Holophaga sp.]